MQIRLPPVEIAQRAPCREIVGRGLQDQAQLALRLLVLVELHQAPTERHPRGDVGRMEAQTGARRVDGFVEPAGAPILLRQRGEGDRRRVGFDPASEFLETG